jgi:hypothetical protein
MGTRVVRPLSRRMVVMGIGLLLVMLICGTCFISTLASTRESVSNCCCPESDPNQIEEVARFRLPPSTSNLWSWCGGMQGWAAYARFEMSPSDLNGFVSSTIVQPPLSTIGRPERLIASDQSEIPDEVSLYLYGLYDSAEFDQEIFIDISDAEKYIVYLSVLAG